MSITLNEIEHVAITYDYYTKGAKLFKNRSVNAYKVDNYNGREYIEASVTDSKSYDVSIVITNQAVGEFSCGCKAFDQSKSACEHIVAALLTYYFYSKRKTENRTSVSKANKTDPLAEKLISEYQSQGFSNLDYLSQDKVELIPSIGINYLNKLYLTFTVGHSRQYIIRDLNEFINHFKTYQRIEYGKGLTLKHHKNSFDEKSKALLAFIFNHYHSESNPYSRYENNKDVNRRLVLEKLALDTFYTMYKSNTIKWAESYDLLNVSEDTPEIILTLNRETSKLYRLTLNQHLKYTQLTQNGFYLIIGETLYKLERSIGEKAGLLFEAFLEQKSLMVNESDMRALFQNVISEVKGVLTLEIDENIEERYAPIPLEAKLYLDMPQSNIVTGELKFYYKGEEVDPFGDITGDTNRNIKDETIVLNQLYHFMAFDSESKTFYLKNDEAIYILYQEGVNELSRGMEVYATDAFKRLIRRAPKMSIGIQVTNDWLDLSFKNEEFPLDELFDVLKSYQKQKKYHRLKDGTFIDLEDQSFEEYSQIIDGLNLTKADFSTGEVEVPKYRAMYLNQVIQRSQTLVANSDETFTTIVDDLKEVKRTFLLSNHFKTILRNYQKSGYNWLRTLSSYGFGGILADEMGLGKTIQIISLVDAYVKETKEPHPTLVVCPASLVYNWEVEFQQFASDLKVLPLVGTIEERQELLNKLGEYDVIITSYDYIKRDIDKYEGIYFKFHIIDEAQYIKNHQTQNAQSVKQIKSSCRFALTGTPIENRLSELWSIFDFVMPGYLYNYHRFSTQFEKPIVREGDELAIEKLKSMIQPFILRRLKKDVLKELPEKYEVIRYAKLEGEQKRLYQANLALLRADLQSKASSEGLETNKILVLSMLTRLRQLCCHPGLYYDNYQEGSAKLELCLDMIQSLIASGSKILLFSQFTSMLDIIHKALDKLKINHYILQGSTKKEERQRLVEAFNQDDTPVFLISLKAGGTGLNLTAANTVIHYDPWWNVSAQNQATDRSHRIGQVNEVTVFKLIAKNTIEEKILKLQESKLKISDALIVQDDGVITKMNQNEILELFED